MPFSHRYSTAILTVSSKRMRQSSQDYSRAKSPGFVKPAVSPIKPSDLLSLQHPLDDQGTPTHVYSSQRLPNVSPRISAEEIGLQISISPFEVDFLFDAQISPEKKLDGSPRFPFGSPTQSSWPEQDAQDSLSKRASLVHLCTAAPEMTMTDLKGATMYVPVLNQIVSRALIQFAAPIRSRDRRNRHL